MLSFFFFVLLFPTPPASTSLIIYANSSNSGRHAYAVPVEGVPSRLPQDYSTTHLPNPKEEEEDLIFLRSSFRR